jgi:hypothetical protein
LPSAIRSMRQSTSYRPISTPGSESLMKSVRIRGSGASARRRCKHSLTRCHWRAKNHISFRPFRKTKSSEAYRPAHTVCQIEHQLLHFIDAPITKQSKKNSFILSKTFAVLCRLNVDIIMNGLIEWSFDIGCLQNTESMFK